jgi:hypothetical protein
MKSPSLPRAICHSLCFDAACHAFRQAAEQNEWISSPSGPRLVAVGYQSLVSNP